MKKRTLPLLFASFGLTAVLAAAPAQEDQAKKQKKPKDKVSITAGDAEVSVSGDGRVVVKAGDAKVEVKGTPGVAGSGRVDEDNKQIVIRGSNQVHDFDCKGRSVKITGGGNFIELSGDCGELVVEGDGNVVKVGGVPAIAIVGNENLVQWTRATVGEKRPRIRQSGSGNAIQQIEDDPQI